MSINCSLFARQNCYTGNYLKGRLQHLQKDSDKFSPIIGEFSNISSCEYFLKDLVSGFNSSITGSSLDCLSLIVQSISSAEASNSPQNSPNPNTANHLHQTIQSTTQNHLSNTQHFKCEFDAKVNWKKVAECLAKKESSTSLDLSIYKIISWTVGGKKIQSKLVLIPVTWSAAIKLFNFVSLLSGFAFIADVFSQL